MVTCTFLNICTQFDFIYIKKIIENLFHIILSAWFCFSNKKKKCTFTYSLKVLVNKKNPIRIYKCYDYTSKCSSNSMWLLCMLSTARFVGSQVDGKDDKGNLFQSSNLNPLGRYLRSSQMTLRIVKYLRLFIFSRFNCIFLGCGKDSVMPRISSNP